MDDVEKVGNNSLQTLRGLNTFRLYATEPPMFKLQIRACKGLYFERFDRKALPLRENERPAGTNSSFVPTGFIGRELWV